MADNNDLKPSELLKLKNCNQSKVEPESCFHLSEAEWESKINPHIEELTKYKHEPLEIMTYLEVHIDDEYLTDAVYSVYFELREIAYMGPNSDTYMMSDIETHNSGSRTYNYDKWLFILSQYPDLFKTIFHLKNHLVNDTRSAVAYYEDLSSIGCDLESSLERFKTTKEKLDYLNKRAFYYTDAHDDLKGKETFSDEDIKKHRFLQVLIEKRRVQVQLYKLEKSVEEIGGNGKDNDKQGKEKRSVGGTKEQNLLAMYFLLDYLNAKGKNIDKAKFISFLTGYSEKKIEQEFPKVLEKANDNFTAFENNAKMVQQYFEALGLSEIVKMIDNELSI